LRQSIVVLVVFGALADAPGGRASQDALCLEEGKRAFDDLVERWTWESFWDGSTSGFRYRPRANGEAEVFWNADMVGMCSQQLGSCTAYERSGGRLGQFALSSRVRGGEISPATDAFLHSLNEPRIVAEGGDTGSRGLAGSYGPLEGRGVVQSIPTPGRVVVVQQSTSGFQSCNLPNWSFPPLGPPVPIRDKITPASLSSFKGWLDGNLHPWPVGAKSEYVIPYYGPDDPMVYVLVRVGGVTESVIFIVAEPDGDGWRIGGHFDPKESPAQVHRLARLILSARMTSVVR
jgi:hypothetical protein